MYSRLRLLALTWLGLQLGCAATLLAATGTAESAAPAPALTAKPTEPVASPEELALKTAYLDRYSWKKFKAMLHLLPAPLPADKVEQLRKILAKREVTLAEARPTATRLGVNPDTYIETQIAAIRQELTEALGPDTTKAFEDFLRTLPQRKAVWDINFTLTYDGHAMNVEQLEKLTRLISEQEAGLKITQPTPKEIDAYIAGKNQAKEKILQDAASFLSAPQLEEVRHELEMQLNFLKWQRSRMPASPAP